MRFSIRAALFLALSASVGVSAQPGGDSTLDPTPPHLYFPLAVGNVWEYANTRLLPLYDGFFMRREIVRDTVIDGTRYFVEMRTRNDDDGTDWHSPRWRVVRFDTTLARPMERSGSGEGPFECPFRGDFGVSVTCWDDTMPEGDYSVEGGLDTVIPFGGGCRAYLPPGELEVQSLKTFYPLGPVDPGSIPYYAAPIGYVGDTPGYCTGCSRNLTYARVYLDEGVYEVGERYAVSSDDAPEAAGLMLQAGPNPTVGDLVLVLDLPSAATLTLEAFDALGRRVWTQSVVFGAGRQRVPVDASGWAPGLYVVRARTDRTRATTTVVRR